jgi:hypothetical protein
MVIRMLHMFEVLSVGVALIGACAAGNASPTSDPGAGTTGSTRHRIFQQEQAPQRIQVSLSAQLSATPLRVASSDELDGVEQALETYQAAFENLSLPQMRQIWPTLGSRREAAFKEVFEVFRETDWTRKLGLVCATPMIGGETISVECEETLTYGEPKGKPKEVGPNRVAIVLRRQASRWIVEDMKGW